MREIIELLISESQEGRSSTTSSTTTSSLGCSTSSTIGSGTPIFSACGVRPSSSSSSSYTSTSSTSCDAFKPKNSAGGFVVSPPRQPQENNENEEEVMSSSSPSPRRPRVSNTSTSSISAATAGRKANGTASKLPLVVPAVVKPEHIDWRAVQLFQGHILPQLPRFNTSAEVPAADHTSLKQSPIESAVAPADNDTALLLSTPEVFLLLQRFKGALLAHISEEMENTSTDLLACSRLLGQSRGLLFLCDLAHRHWKAAHEEELRKKRELEAAELSQSAGTPNTTTTSHASSVKEERLDPVVLNIGLNPQECFLASAAITAGHETAKKAYLRRLLKELVDLHKDMLLNTTPSSSSPSSDDTIFLNLNERTTQLRNCIQALIDEGINIYRNVFEVEFLTTVKNGAYTTTTSVSATADTTTTTTRSEEKDLEDQWNEMAMERDFAEKLLHPSTVAPFLADVLSSRFTTHKGLLKRKLSQFVSSRRGVDFKVLYSAVQGATEETVQEFQSEFSLLLEGECLTAASSSTPDGSSSSFKLNSRVFEVAIEYKNLVKEFANGDQKLMKAIDSTMVKRVLVKVKTANSPRECAAIVLSRLKKALQDLANKQLAELNRQNQEQQHTSSSISSTTSTDDVVQGLKFDVKDLSEYVATQDRVLSELCHYCSHSHTRAAVTGKAKPLVRFDGVVVDLDAMVDELKQQQLRRLFGHTPLLSFTCKTTDNGVGLGGGSAGSPPSSLIAAASPVSCSGTASELVVGRHYSDTLLSAEVALAAFVAKHFGAGRAYHLHRLCEDLKTTRQLQSYLDATTGYSSCSPSSDSSSSHQLQSRSKSISSVEVGVRVLNISSAPVLLVRPPCPSLKESADMAEVVFSQLQPKRKLLWTPTLALVQVEWNHDPVVATPSSSPSAQNNKSEESYRYGTTTTTSTTTSVYMNAVHLELLDHLLSQEKLSTAPSPGSIPVKIAADLDMNKTVVSKHLSELQVAGLISQPMTLSRGQSWVSVARAPTSASLDPPRNGGSSSSTVIHVGGVGVRRLKTTGNKRSNSISTKSAQAIHQSTKRYLDSPTPKLSSQQRQALIDCALVRLLKSEGTITLHSIFPLLAPILRCSSCGLTITSTETLGAVDRLVAREYATRCTSTSEKEGQSTLISYSA